MRGQGRSQMSKYMRKSKTTGDVALMEVSKFSFGVRTRAKTLALQRLQKPAAATSYLQLRSRRLEKSPIFVANGDSKRQKHLPRESRLPNPNPNANPNCRASSRLRVSSVNSGPVGLVSLDCLNKEEGRLETEKVVDKEEEIQGNNNYSIDVAVEASFGENVLEFEGRERSTRETTPCSLIRDSGTIRTPPGSTTKPTSSTVANRRIQNSMRRHIPTAHEMDEFCAVAENQQRRLFIDKYNFDPVKDTPLPGRYEWVKVDP